MDSNNMFGKLCKIKNAARDIQSLMDLGTTTISRRDRLYSPIPVPQAFYERAQKIYENVAAMKLETLSLITQLEADYQNPEHPTDEEAREIERKQYSDKCETTPERRRDDG
jgi:hypothetical protein